MTSLRTDLHPQSRTASVVLYLGAAALVALLVLASTLGPLFIVLTLGVAAFLVVVATVGSERLGILVLAVGYFTAPFYKGVAFGGSAVVTAPDLLLLAGFALLLPRLVRGRVHFPPAYSVGVSLVLVAGLGASVFSVRAGESFMALGFWMIVMIGLPVAFALWGPLGRHIDLLADQLRGRARVQLRAGRGQGQGGGRPARGAGHPPQLPRAGRDADDLPADLPRLPAHRALRPAHCR